jgi:hypothetical protein
MKPLLRLIYTNKKEKRRRKLWAVFHSMSAVFHGEVMLHILPSNLC